VALHLVGASELLVADGTGVRRGEVDASVLDQSPFVQELLVADLARVRTLVGVQSRVLAQQSDAEELLVARAAAEARHVAVDDHVGPQQRRARELAAADVARERTLAHVLVQVQQSGGCKRPVTDVTAD